MPSDVFGQTVKDSSFRTVMQVRDTSTKQSSAPSITKEEIADEVGKQVRAAFEKYFPQLNFNN